MATKGGGIAGSDVHQGGGSGDVVVHQMTEEEKNRAAAFGAIRRAAREARDWESVQASATTVFVATQAEFAARQIRRAIRTAIGSEKEAK